MAVLEKSSGEPRARASAAPRVAMVGAGQLARMTHRAAIDLGIELSVLAGSPEDAAVRAGARAVMGECDDPATLRELAAGADVLTFDLSAGGPRSLAGDIVVSAETARRAARELGWPPRHELAYYVVHGLLHLAGEDDGTPGERRRMRRRERAVMAASGLPVPPRRPRKPAPHGR